MDPTETSDSGLNSATTAEEYAESLAKSLKPIEKTLANNQDRMRRTFGTLFGPESNETTRSEMGDRLFAAIDSDDAEREEIETAFGAFLRSIVIFPDIRSELADTKLDEQVIDLLVDIYLDYGDQIKRWSYRGFQGRRWWSDITTELAIRGDELGFTHHLMIDQSDEVEITNNLNSALELVIHILQKENKALNNFGGVAAEQIDEEVARNFAYQTRDLLNIMEEHELISFEEDDE